MLSYPNIDPVAIALGPLKIHWYGLMYLVGIGGAWWLASRRLQRFDPQWTKDTLSDLVFWVAMGIILGGRLGYVLPLLFSSINPSCASLVCSAWLCSSSFL